MMRLFDDEFGSDTLGVTWDDSPTDSRSLLSGRIFAATAIMTCVIGTITDGSADDVRVASIEFRGQGQSLIDSSEVDCPKISITPHGYSSSLLRQSGALLVGKSVVIFLHRFHDKGQVTLHWHADPDRPVTRSAIQGLRSSQN